MTPSRKMQHWKKKKCKDAKTYGWLEYEYIHHWKGSPNTSGNVGPARALTGAADTKVRGKNREKANTPTGGPIEDRKEPEIGSTSAKKESLHPSGKRGRERGAIQRSRPTRIPYRAHVDGGDLMRRRKRKRINQRQIKERKKRLA